MILRGPLQAGVRTNMARAETRLRQGWARNRMRRTSAPRVLVVDVVIPAHDRGAGHLRLTWILRLLRSLGCHVTLFTTHQRVRRDPYTKQLERLGIEVELSAASFEAFAATRRGIYDLVLLSGADAAASVIDDARRAFPRPASSTTASTYTSCARDAGPRSWAARASATTGTRRSSSASSAAT